MTATRRAYDPYGNPRGTQPTSWADNHGYLGKPADPSTGLDLLGARNYDPALGRFLTADPILEIGDPNQMGGYTYAGDNPSTGSDPTGLSWWDTVTELFGAAVVVTTGVGAGLACSEVPIIAPECVEAGIAAGAALAGTLGVDPGPIGEHTLGGSKKRITKLTEEVEEGAEKQAPHAVTGPEGPVASGATGEGAAQGGGLEAAAAAAAEEAAHTLENESALARNSEGVPATGPAKDPEPGTPSADSGGNPLKSGTDDPSAPATPGNDPADSGHGTSGRGGKCSFSPDTQVLMGDGTTKPIADLTAGDQVEAANPDTGVDQGARTVTATWINHDDDLVDLTVQTGDGTDQPLHTTSKHPFWDATTHTWTPAAELAPGDELTTNTGTHVQVKAVVSTPGAADRYNLTVTELHTYYVLAGNSPVLVHNENGDACDLNALRGKLPKRDRDNDPTAGIAINEFGKAARVVTSANSDLANMRVRVQERLRQWGFISSTMRSSDVEQKIAASMLNADGTTRAGCQHVRLLINNAKGACDEALGCDMVLPFLLNKGQSLTVHFWDQNGILNTVVYDGLAEFQ
ncbi:polymorphic toxin-type HINT domain-containing protein [Kitasatospora phosalacinea]|uniref:polymorphic toxin-type HINT domain-containing protein n=1 Tax=Kitasatospora phosalacinea TaxID=2065 RepID=UPI0035D758D5